MDGLGLRSVACAGASNGRWCALTGDYIPTARDFDADEIERDMEWRIASYRAASTRKRRPAVDSRQYAMFA